VQVGRRAHPHDVIVECTNQDVGVGGAEALQQQLQRRRVQ